MKSKTIRIAVAVNDRGEWSAAGYQTPHAVSEDQLKDIAWEGLDDYGDKSHLVWITASIPIPEVEEVEALAVEIGEPEVEA
jgi:hypothetical protein